MERVINKNYRNLLRKVIVGINGHTFLISLKVKICVSFSFQYICIGDIDIRDMPPTLTPLVIKLACLENVKMTTSKCFTSRQIIEQFYIHRYLLFHCVFFVRGFFFHIVLYEHSDNIEQNLYSFYYHFNCIYLCYRIHRCLL